MSKKYCLIIDTYPQTQKEQEILLENLKILKEGEIDVLVTSHYPCSSEIIENCTYFLFEKKNNYYYLDSEVLNENIRGVSDPIYLKYLYIGEEVFRDRLVVTGWSVAVTSQMFNAIKLLHGKGYEYSFYLVSDFICPQDIKSKLEEILEKSNSHRNYFIKNSPLFSSWYAGFFFGFTIDDELISRLPNEDLSENKIYQKYFPNCSAEDVMIRVWGKDDNLVEEYHRLDEIFGEKKWNLVSSSVKGGSSFLHFNTSSSFYFNKESRSLCLMLHVSGECPCETVIFEIQILNNKEEVIFDRSLELSRHHWFKEEVTSTIQNEEKVTLKKYIRCKNDENLFFRDSTDLKIEDLDYYSTLKNFEKIK